MHRQSRGTQQRDSPRRQGGPRRQLNLRRRRRGNQCVVLELLRLRRRGGCRGNGHGRRATTCVRRPDEQRGDLCQRDELSPARRRAYVQRRRGRVRLRDSLDPDGDPRVGDGRVDIGADELPSAPIVSTGAATAIAATTAEANGTVDPQATTVTYKFEYGLTPALGSSTSVASVTAPATATAVQAMLFGLPADTTVYYRIWAQSGGHQPRIVVGTTQSFTTLPTSAPGVTTQAAEVGPFSALLQGLVDPNRRPTTWQFAWREASGEVFETTPTEDAGSGDEPVSVSAEITGLIRNHLQLPGGGGERDRDGAWVGGDVHDAAVQGRARRGQAETVPVGQRPAPRRARRDGHQVLGQRRLAREAQVSGSSAGGASGRVRSSTTPRPGSSGFASRAGCRGRRSSSPASTSWSCARRRRASGRRRTRPSSGSCASAS